ncbi:MAG: ABC transporter ATP-binding protein [Anaerolineales bacterium]|nr:ABC transporter ATP-binding protein [Anaerolineales bacterium]
MPIIHEKDHIEESAPCASGEQDGRILSVNDLQFHYPDGRQALKGISLEMARCEKIALVGPNGAGKSTFLQHINGLLEGEGTINVAGLPLDKENLPIIRAKVGFVFQNPDDQLFSPTVYEDVAFGPLHMGFPEDEICERVKAALAQVGMSDYIQRLSHYLSTGEKKRIAIATVLAMQPDLLVLDEPTAGLDPRARRALINLLEELQIGMIIATHDLLMVRELLPRMVIIDGGQIVADGETESLLADKDLLEVHGLEMPV